MIYIDSVFAPVETVVAAVDALVFGVVLLITRVVGVDDDFVSSDVTVNKDGRKEMFYLTTHSTHFIYGYMASDIW